MNINLEVEHDNGVSFFISETEERFKKAENIKAFINKIDIKKYRTYERDFYNFVVELVPPFWLLIDGIVVVLMLIFGWKSWLIIPLAFTVLCAWVWSPFYFKTMLKKGLKKTGYNGKIRFISDKRLEEYLEDHESV
jgi:hypothetical protein